MSTKTYELQELAQALKFTPSYVKMILKKLPTYTMGEPIPENVASQVAKKVRRPWPPAA